MDLPSQFRFVNVRIGEYNFDTDIDCDPINPADCLPAPIDMEVTEMIAHPEYNSKIKDTHHDIALLRLERKVEFTENFKPVCLPLDPPLWTTDYSNRVFQVTGWGWYVYHQETE